MNSLRRTAWATIFLMASTACAEPNDSAARLQGLPRPWDKRVHRLKPDEYKETLRYWAEKHRDILEVNQPGASVEGEPIYLLKITDPSVPDDNKQIIVIAAMHGGPERCGTTTLMHLRPLPELPSRDVRALLLPPQVPLRKLSSKTVTGLRRPRRARDLCSGPPPEVCVYDPQAAADFLSLRPPPAGKADAPGVRDDQRGVS